jgi:adenylate cyclase
LDFSVISPALNEVARIGALCEPLDQAVLVSAKFVTGMTAADIGSSRSLPRFVRLKEPKEVFVIDFGRLEYADRHQKRVG